MALILISTRLFSIQEDYEVQNWAKMLSDPVDGPGIKGVFGGGKFEELEDLVKTITATIFLSSVQHAAANFCQYDEYAFPPNYPAGRVFISN